MIQEIASRGWKKVNATIEYEPVYCDNTTLILVRRPNTQFPDLRALLCIYNSRFFTWFLLKSSDKAYASGDFSRLNVHDFLKLPFPWKTSAVTPKERTQKLELVIGLYHGELQNSSGRIVKAPKAIAFSDLMKALDDAKTTCNLLFHDFLGHLAEQMMDLNKQKQAETKRFLNWLEVALKIEPDENGNCGIERLSGKTVLQDYLGDYQKGEEHASFNALWEVVQKNSRRLSCSLTTAFQERIRQ